MIWILLALATIWLAFVFFMIQRHLRQMRELQAAYDQCMADLKTHLEAMLRAAKGER